MDAMVDQETGVRGYLIAGDEKFLSPIIRVLMPTQRRSRAAYAEPGDILVDGVLNSLIRSPIIEFVLTGADSTCG